jgi:hypothetical protein
MAITTTLAACNTNPALNGPDGTDLLSTADDAIRYGLSFIAQLRDGTGFTAGGIPVAALAYLPVQQGGGANQGSNPIKIGWGTGPILGKLGLQVDGTDFGATWPISITGNAATATSATSATTAGTASNANALSGTAIAEFVLRGSSQQFRSIWDSGNGWWYMAVNGGPQPAYTNWNAVQGKPTDLSAFTNGPGYVQRYGNSLVDVGSPRNDGTVGRAIPCTDARIGYFRAGTSSTMVVQIDGTEYGWGVTISDERLKENVQPTTADSLANIDALDFKSFDFRADAPALFAGQHREVGVIAQQAEKVRKSWVFEVGEFKQLNQEQMLLDAMHAIQALGRKVAALERRIVELEAR